MIWFSRAKAPIIRFTAMKRKKVSFPENRALKGDKVCLDDYLTLTQVAYHKENMP